MLIMLLYFAGNLAFAATDPTVLAQQIKEAEADAAVYMAQKAASEARKAKEEADTAAIEAENGRATQMASQQLALQTAAVALDKAKNEVLASRVNTIQNAVSLNGLNEIKRDAVPPKSNVGEFQNAAEQTATFAAQIAPRVTATAVAGAIRMEAQSGGNLQPVSFVDLGKASIDFGAMAFATSNEQADVSIVLALGKVDTEIENAETNLAKLKVQLGTAQAEKSSVVSRIAHLIARMVAMEGGHPEGP